MIVRLHTRITRCCAVAAIVALGTNAASAIPVSGPAAPEKTPIPHSSPAPHATPSPAATPVAAVEYVVMQAGQPLAIFHSVQGLPAPGVAATAPAVVVLGGTSSVYTKDTIAKWGLDLRTGARRDFDIRAVQASTGQLTTAYACGRGLLERVELSSEGTLLSVTISCATLSALAAHGK
jgi:hypothetical protein